MKSALTMAVTGLMMALVLASPASTHEGTQDTDRGCTTRSIAGNWLFATDVGQAAGLGGITAIGTLSIDRKGNVSGKFDVTIAQVVHTSDTYTGSITVNADCTAAGTLTTSDGSSRTDSMVILDGEIWGMSQDPAILWTFRAKRISR